MGEAVIAADGSVLQEKFVWTGKNDPSDIRLKVTIYGDKTIHVISQEEDVTFLFDNPEIGTCIHKAYGVKNGAMYSLEHQHGNVVIGHIIQSVILSVKNIQMVFL